MIIVKRIKKAGHGHHGGAWKVAYADFVTAMMAFFLLLWLLNAVSQEQLEGISDYFAPISTSKATSGGGGLLQGRTVDVRGVFNAIERKSHTFAQFAQETLSDSREARGGARDPSLGDADDETDDENADDHNGEAVAERAAKRAEAVAQWRERAQFEKVEHDIREALEHAPELGRLANSLLIDETPEGLRIQIIDQDGLAMFPRGSSAMHDHTRKLLELVAGIIASMPQQIEVTGHTDATPFHSGSTYGNWELSADRANAARRLFLQLGIPEARIARVVGKAATTPLYPADPTAAGNRRLSVVLLRRSPAPSPAPAPSRGT